MKSPQVQHGFVIIKPDGRVWSDYLYRDRVAAEHTAAGFSSGLKVYPAKRVTSMRQASTTLVKACSNLIIDKSDDA